MTILATIQVRRRGELPVVGVLVAIQALRELHLVKGIFTRRSVAFFTGNARMLSFQRIVRIRMFFHTKLIRFPAIYCMALLAFTFAGSGLELALVGIGGVTVRALRERQGTLEIACSVAFAAADLDVHSQQRIFCFRMIEMLHLFPVVEIVAALTIRSEFAFVGIRVATYAVLRKTQKRGGEILALNQRSFRRTDVRGSMAFLASNAGMFIYQQIPRQLVVELLE